MAVLVAAAAELGGPRGAQGAAVPTARRGAGGRPALDIEDVLQLLGRRWRGQWGRLVCWLIGCRRLRGLLGQCGSDGLDTPNIDPNSAIFDKEFDHAVIESAQDEMRSSPVRRELTISAQVVCFVEPHHLPLRKLMLTCCDVVVLLLFVCGSHVVPGCRLARMLQNVVPFCCV